MLSGPKQSVTQIIQALSAGEDSPDHESALWVFNRLRAAAQHLMGDQPDHHTLQATALVNEAFLKLRQGRSIDWEGRVHFFRVASRAMRQILTDHARRRSAGKRTPPGEREPLDDVFATYQNGDLDFIELDRALARLAQWDPLMSQFVDLRYFGGLSVDEAARTLGMSPRQAQRDWKATRAWLSQELS